VETAEQIVDRLGLAPLPLEGGWFRRTGESPGVRPDGRAAWSEILFLISPGDFSAMHRLAADETWTHRGGAPAELLLLGPGGAGRLVTLGPGAERGGRIPAGVWQGARTDGPWALFACRVEPAWREEDFRLGDAAELLREFPAWAPHIRARVREV